jgi:predicted chitinase
MKYAVRSACYFWVEHNLHERADAGPTDAVVDSITDVVNYNTDSRPKRKENFQKIWDGEYFK